MSVDFADLKPGVLNFLLFCVYFLLAKTFLKFALTKFYVPGLSEMAKSPA